MASTHQNPDKYLVLLGGPTGVGKTELSLSLAKHWDTEILSVDSRQIYKEMSIGTAKPSEYELSRVRHHFINEKSITERYTAADYERDALQRLDQLFENKSVVLGVGGTGLYMRALIHGFDEIPNVDQKVMARVSNLFTEKGLNGIVAELNMLDPDYVSQVDLKNPHRVQRALAVCFQTGQPFSSFLSGTDKLRPFRTIELCLTRERQTLYQRIERRVERMVEQGLEDEVRSLEKYRDRQALRTVGYQELFDYFDGKLTYNEAIERIKRNSRRYAKRQLTWFRNQGEWRFFPMENEVVEQAVIQHVEDLMTTR